jgi:uncharacterized protein
MPHFHMMFLDKPDSLELRLATRAAHLDYIKSYGEKIKVAGPLLLDEKPYGSIIIIECETYDDAVAYAESDPYNIADLFAHIAISQYNPVLGEWVK